MSNDESPTSRSLSFWGATVAGLIFLIAAWAGPRIVQGQNAPAILKLAIVDEITGQAIAARVEVVDKDGKAYVADDALLTGGD